MKLSRARVCLECDEVYEADHEGNCPVCGDRGANLALWVTRQPVAYLSHIGGPYSGGVETANSGRVGRPI